MDDKKPERVLRVQFGDGKYEDVVQLVKEKTNAEHVLVMVVNGDKGTAFGVHLKAAGAANPLRHTIGNIWGLIDCLRQVGESLREAAQRLATMTPEQVELAMEDESAKPPTA